MLKLVLLAAALAAVTATPIYAPYMSPYFPSPYGGYPFGYPGAVPGGVPVPYLRTGLPSPYFRTGLPTPYAASGIPTPFAGGEVFSDAMAAEETEPLLPFTSIPSRPMYLTPEQHHMYEEALKSHDPLGYADMVQAVQDKKKETEQKN